MERELSHPGSHPFDAEPACVGPEHPPSISERELSEIISGQAALYQMAADCRRAQRQAFVAVSRLVAEHPQQ